jgi:CRP-like cAMP-binding protein
MFDSRDPLGETALMEHALRLTQGFAAWPPSAMNQLLSNSHVGRYAKGQVILVEEGTPGTLAIVSGYAILGRMPLRGGRALVALFGPGHVVGFTRMFERHNDQDQIVYDFRALNDTVVVQMPTSQIQKILDGEPALWRDMAKMLLKQHRDMVDSLLCQLIGPLPRRLVATIERLAILYGNKDGKEIRLRLRLTQEDLAELLHVTRQTVNKELRALVACGAISMSYNTITVLNLEELRNLANKY